MCVFCVSLNTFLFAFTIKEQNCTLDTSQNLSQFTRLYDLVVKTGDS